MINDTYYEVLMNTDVDDLLDLCTINHFFLSTCQSKKFLMNKLQHDVHVPITQPVNDIKTLIKTINYYHIFLKLKHYMITQQIKLGYDRINNHLLNFQELNYFVPLLVDPLLMMIETLPHNVIIHGLYRKTLP